MRHGAHLPISVVYLALLLSVEVVDHTALHWYHILKKSASSYRVDYLDCRDSASRDGQIDRTKRSLGL